MLHLLLLIIIGSGGTQESPKNQVAADEIPYRLLAADLPSADARFRDAGFVVSVDKFINRVQVERLICQVVKREDIDSYQRISIQVFYQLDEYLPPAHSPTLERQHSEHRLASYFWNSSLPGGRKRLVITKDSQGKPDLKSFSFDHTKSCIPK